jgi:LytS/YehU family sensor histidine kinase
MQTPVGYRCSNCLRGQQAVFDTAQGYDHAIAAVVGAVGVGVATYLLGFLDLWGFFVAPVLGGILSGVIRTAVRRRRSHKLPLMAALGGGLGVLVNLGLLLASILSAFGDPNNLVFIVRRSSMILWPLAHGALVIAVMYSRLKTIRT